MTTQIIRSGQRTQELEEEKVPIETPSDYSNLILQSITPSPILLEPHESIKSLSSDDQEEKTADFETISPKVNEVI